MDSCVLCLEINKDILDCIKADSTQWQELDIGKIIEKHFWSYSSIQPSSWICLSCWQQLDNFHNFYLRIEEAHMNFGKIKVEDGEIEKDVKSFCFLEPEILLDQVQQKYFTEPELITDRPIHHSSVQDKHVDELNLDLTLPDPESKDPLEKSTKSKKRNCSIKDLTEENNSKNSRVKEELMEASRDCIENISDNNYDSPDFSDHPSKSSRNKVRKANSKAESNRKEYDKFIAEHFKQMLCVLCGEPFENFTDMHKHFHEIHKQRGYIVCCKRKFSERTRFVDHLRSHLNPDYFKCNDCGKTMSDRIKFNTHMLLIHRANEVVKQHCCDVCGKSFRQAYVLRAHKLTHLPEDEKKFPCSDCGKNYGTASILKQHMQVVHLKRFVKVCYICGKEINSTTEFKAHMDKHEGNPLPDINCDICGLRLTTERGLKRHKDSQHPIDGKKEHPCPICPKVSPTPKALRKHISTMHEKGYDYKCTICQKEFKRPEALREHMASHTGTPLYTCPWCPKTFYSNGNMHAHRKKIHPKEWEEAKLQKYSGNIKSTNDKNEQDFYV